VEGNKIYLDFMVKDKLGDNDVTECEIDNSFLIKLWYNNDNVMIKNSMIHKDSIDLIKNLDKKSTLYLENVSLKGLKSINGNLKLNNCVV